jgi:GPH family glycoside/pentoside/hexuronide:cation symporter
MTTLSAPSAHKPAPGDRIPLSTKLIFSTGGSVDYIAAGMATGVLWVPYFSIGLGMDLAALSVILMILRGWDAVVDQINGNLSDNARTRWGRRRPFIAVGAVMTAVIYPFLWRLPAGLGEFGQYIYLTLVGAVFYAFFSCWQQPYYALQMELTPGYDERTRLSAWMALVQKLVIAAGGWSLALLTSSLFADTAGRPDMVHGMKTCSWVIAGIILVVGIMPALFVKERYYEAKVKSEAREPFWQGLKESFRCGPLWHLIGISFFILLGSASMGTLGQFVNIYFINKGQLNAAFVIDGWSGMAVMIVGVLSIPFWTWASEKIDKKNVVALLLAGTAFGHLLNLVCLRPDMPYLQLIPAISKSFIMGALWIFFPSMKADIADYDEMKGSRRREGAINAFFSWFIKVASALGPVISGFAAKLSGIDTMLGEQPEAVVRRLVLLYMVIPLAIWTIPLFFIWRYPLNRRRMAEVRTELEARRGAL